MFHLSIQGRIGCHTQGHCTKHDRSWDRSVSFSFLDVSVEILLSVVLLCLGWQDVDQRREVCLGWRCYCCVWEELLDIFGGVVLKSALQRFKPTSLLKRYFYCMVVFHWVMESLCHKQFNISICECEYTNSRARIFRRRCFDIKYFFSWRLCPTRISSTKEAKGGN